MPRGDPDTPVGDTNVDGDANSERLGEKLTLNNLQKQFSVLVDNTRLRELVKSLAASYRYPDMRRLEELRDPT
eukprot:5447254-Karenia_brevis.AAC.1